MQVSFRGVSRRFRRRFIAFDWYSGERYGDFNKASESIQGVSRRFKMTQNGIRRLYSFSGELQRDPRDFRGVSRSFRGVPGSFMSLQGRFRRDSGRFREFR